MDYYRYNSVRRYANIYNRNLSTLEWIEYSKRLYMNFCEDGTFYEEKYGEKEYRLDGKYHNIKGPSLICFYNDDIENLAYFINGQRHNSNGPAYIHYLEHSAYEEYWINGVHYEDEEEFFDIQKKIRGVKEEYCIVNEFK